MAEPALDAPAALVRRLDPDLFACALFAPEPARGRLMLLHAFDVELSRITDTTREPMIARMRLQWWRDIAVAAAAGTAPPMHELATPLHPLLGALPADLVEGLISARERELEGPLDRASFDLWADERFAGLIRLGQAALGAEPLAGPTGEAGRALAAAFLLRTAAAMAAASGRVLLPDLAAADRATLAAGGATDSLAAYLRKLAGQGISALDATRARRAEVPRAARPAWLPLSLAAPVLRQAERSPARMVEPYPGLNPARRSLQLLGTMATGRW